MSDYVNGVRTFAIYGSYEGINLPALTIYLNDSIDILSFWNHIPLLYCVKTRINISDLRQKLQPFFQSNFFLIVEVSTHGMDGMLPKAAWDWFNTPAPLEKRRSSIATLFGYTPLPPPRS